MDILRPVYGKKSSTSLDENTAEQKENSAADFTNFQTHTIPHYLELNNMTIKESMEL